MPTFCGKCGAPVTGKFCGSCGAAMADATASASPVETAAADAGAGTTPPQASPVAPAPSYTAPAAPTGAGSVLKIILIVLGVFLFLGLLGMGSCMYVAYRAKQKINALAGDATPYRGKKDPCALVTMSEVSRAMGQTVTGMEPVGMSACVYQFGGNNQQLAIETTWESGAMTMALTHGAMKQISGMETFNKVDGLGDEAYIAPMGSALMMRKGDVLVNIDLRQGGLNVDGAKEIARKIASRL